MRRQHIILILLAVLLAMPASATERLAQVVDSDGMLLTLVSGEYGTLFPTGDEAPEYASVLALDITLQDDEKHRVLVPTTASLWPESSAKLLFDPRAGVTYLLWSAPFNGLHPMLYLTTFDGSSWGEVLEIVGTIFAPKMDLQLVVAHDSYEPDVGEAIDRTVIHVAWWEPRATGVEKQYTALVLENGSYVGRTLSHSLTGQVGGFDQSSLASELILQESATGALVAGFHDPTSGEIASLEVEVLPLALSLLATRVEEAALAWDPAAGVDLMDAVDAALAEHGSAFHPAVLTLLSVEIAKLFEESDGEDIEFIAEKFGPHIIHIGMRVGANGLVGNEAVSLLTISPTAGQDYISPRHDLKVSSLGRWAVPENLGENPELLFSADGGDALLAWLDAEATEIRYRETLADGTWSELRTLPLSEDFGAEAGFAALADHVRDR